MLILIKGAGDIASGVAWRLWQCGYDVAMTEQAQPTTVRCSVAFSRAVLEGSTAVEGVTARLCNNIPEAQASLMERKIPVLVDPNCEMAHRLEPDALVDAILAKRNVGTTMGEAPIVIALGPGFTAGKDCHAVVETNRGHDLGRVIYRGMAAANTGEPGNIAGYTTERILRAPRSGTFAPVTRIGEFVRPGDLVANVDGEPMRAAIGGVVRGLLPAGTPVVEGMKAGDIDPRGREGYCYTISDKARAIGGGVLEALLHLVCKREGR